MNKPYPDDRPQGPAPDDRPPWALPNEGGPQDRPPDLHDRPHRRKSHAGRVFARILELLAIFLSLLGSSRIARFLTAKLSMDVIVEVTALFGRGAGHALSTFAAMIAAEPRIIALIVTGLILFIELIIFLVRMIRRRSRRRRPYPGR